MRRRATPSLQPAPAPQSPQPFPATARPVSICAPCSLPKTEPVSLPLHWTVYAEGQSGQPGAILFAARAASPHVPVPAGRYVVEARDGPVSASETVDVGDKGPTPVFLVLNAGALHVRAQAQKSGAPLGDAMITVSDAGQGGGGRKSAAGPPLALFKGSEGVALLPAGRYMVRVEQGAGARRARRSWCRPGARRASTLP